jgi:hypothetical protein
MHRQGADEKKRGEGAENEFHSVTLSISQKPLTLTNTQRHRFPVPKNPENFG